MQKRLALCAFGILTLGLMPPAHAAVPTTVGIQGRLMSAAGGPVADGKYTVTFSLYGSVNAAQASWSETAVGVEVSSGAWKYALGTAQPLDPGVVEASKGGWLGLQVGNEAELSRTAVQSAPFALRAQVAEGLQCSGCVTAAMIDPGALAGYAKSADLGAYAKTADLGVYAKTAELSAYAKTAELSEYVKASALAKVAATGQYGDLLGLPVLAKVGTACGSGLLVQGIKADGSLDCGPVVIKGGKCDVGQVVTEVKADGGVVCGAVTASLPADGLAAVSNGLLTNVFDEVYASTSTPKAIPDNNPGGVVDEIAVPETGVVKSISIEVELTTSSTGQITVVLYDPQNTAYTLHKQSGTAKGLKTSFPVPTPVANGDLSSWIGKNPQGTWRLVVADWQASGAATDGAVVRWAMKFKVLSTTKVSITGKSVTVGGLPMIAVQATPPALVPDKKFVELDTLIGDTAVAAQVWLKSGDVWLQAPTEVRVPCVACGTGKDGAFEPTSDVTLVGGTYEFTRFHVPKNVTVTATGAKPLAILVRETFLVDGSLNADGKAGESPVGVAGALGGNGGPGGFAGGGSASTDSALGTGAGGGKGGNSCIVNCPSPGSSGGGGGFYTAGSAGSPPIGKLSPPGGLGGPATEQGANPSVGGSGGGSGAGYYQSTVYAVGGGGGGGGGHLRIIARSISISGSVTANGGAGGDGPKACGGGGSGGVVWLGAETVSVTGTVSAVGGPGGPACGQAGQGGLGFVRIDATAVSGITTPSAALFSAAGISEAIGGRFAISQPKPGVVRATNWTGAPQTVRLVVIR
jgi:subtilisin-like proprotein convertase family protein